MLKIRVENNKSAERDAIERVRYQMRSHAMHSLTGIANPNGAPKYQSCPRCQFAFWTNAEYAYLCATCTMQTEAGDWLGD